LGPPGPYPDEGEAPARWFCRDDPDDAFVLTDGALVPKAETEDTLRVDAPSGGTLGVDTRVDGMLGVDTPTEGTLGVDTRVDGALGVDTPTEGTLGEDTRIEGTPGLDTGGWLEMAEASVAAGAGAAGAEVGVIDTPRPQACQGRASKATKASAHTKAALDFLSAAIRSS
jgi:hypothetical protein